MKSGHGYWMVATAVFSDSSVGLMPLVGYRFDF